MSLDIGGEDVAAPRHRLQKLLTAVVEGASQLEGALNQGIVSNESVRPHGLHQFLLAYKAPGVLHQVLQGLINLGTELDLLLAPEDRAYARIERELAELIPLWIALQGAPLCNAKPLWLRILAFLWRCFVTSSSADCYFELT